MESEKLIEVRDWAKNKIASGAEPPGPWFQYMKLVETLDAILSGMNSVTPKGNLLQWVEHQETNLRLVGGATCQQDPAQHHFFDVPVQLPT